MQLLIIRERGSPERAYDLETDQTTIGRSRTCDLCLPNVSVSKEHARLSWEDDGYVIEDLDAKNGVYVNGERVTRMVLKTGDTITLGKYEAMLVLGQLPRKHMLLDVDSMPRWYAVSLSTADESTHQLSVTMLTRLMNARKLLEAAVIAEESPGEGRWRAEEGVLVFGRGATIPIGGLLTSGQCATVSWNGQNHVIKSHARLTAVRVNGEAVETRVLQIGDSFEVGKSSFRYLVRG